MKFSLMFDQAMNELKQSSGELIYYRSCLLLWSSEDAVNIYSYNSTPRYFEVD